MADVLVLIDLAVVDARAQPRKGALELLAAATRLGDPVAVVVAAPGSTDAVAETLAAHGAARIVAAESADADAVLITPSVDALAALVGSGSPAAVLIGATPEGKDIAGRLAVRLDSGLLSDVVDIAPDGTCTQSIFGGSTTVHARVRRGTPVIAVRPNSFEPVASAGAGTRESIELPPTDAALAARITGGHQDEVRDRPELSEARVVVSGGRGVGSGENFRLIEELADALGGAVGASRAATDAGWYPHQYQVGQTGVTVSPQLYLAAGISGAIQHRAGMQTSKTIVVINKDPEAPIFELADFGVVGDLFDVVPQLTDEVRKRRS
ncbi:MAG: electron transfer flavoprotein subunit alpha/FixB family protein [Mycobacteriales bacterium]